MLNYESGEKKLIEKKKSSQLFKPMTWIMKLE
jgi:hypothetical protein